MTTGCEMPSCNQRSLSGGNHWRLVAKVLINIAARRSPVGAVPTPATPWLARALAHGGLPARFLPANRHNAARFPKPRAQVQFLPGALLLSLLELAWLSDLRRTLSHERLSAQDGSKPLERGAHWRAIGARKPALVALSAVVRSQDVTRVRRSILSEPSELDDQP